jgi:hypothetical protein
MGLKGVPSVRTPESAGGGSADKMITCNYLNIRV